MSAFLLAGLQSFALFHGAEYGFGAHQHGFLQAVHDGHEHQDEQEHGTSRGECDLLLYLDGQTRPASALSVDVSAVEAARVLFAHRESVYIGRAHFSAAPRAPPLSQHI